MIHKLATIALRPLLLFQGLRARRRTVRLPEPPGRRSGVAGEGRPLKLLIAGDSAAAGVGAAHQDEALLGQLVSRLAPAYRVDWTLQARTGATTASTLRHLRKLAASRIDVALTSLGVNDITSGIRCAEWRRQQAELRSLLRERFGASQIIVCGLPPVDGFPALPQPLRWYLGARAKQLSEDLRRDVEADPGCRFLKIDFTRDTGLMAPDGFHPGPQVYAAWGRRAAELALAMLNDPAATGNARSDRRTG